MADIFISYARRDRNKAEKLARTLEKQGWSIWWDARLSGGEIWDEVIERELKAARTVLVLWSTTAVQSRWVKKEARYADQRQLLVPALIEPSDPPLEFSDVQCIELIGWSGSDADPGFCQLLLDLKKKLGVAPSKSDQLERPFHDTLRGGSHGPEMAIIPTGIFWMGSPENDTERFPNECPRHRVSIPNRFAISVCLTTFDQYDFFAAATGRELPDDAGWGRGHQPAVNVSWHDATAYVKWLSDQTSENYRLPSEAEWEYAARAGTETRYWWGDEIGRRQANCRSGGSEWDGKQTSPVGSFQANGFGLYDMHGNVFEWVEDCCSKTYKGSPTDGSPHKRWSCTVRVLRGGSWHSDPRSIRSATRRGVGPDSRGDWIGFRVARSLTIK